MELELSCPRSPFSHTLPCPGPSEGKTLSRVRRDREHPLVSSQNCCRLCGGFQYRLMQKRRSSLSQWGIVYDVKREWRQEISLSKQTRAKSFHEAETGQYVYDCLFEECSLGSTATTAKEEVWKVHLQAKSWPNSTVIFTNGSKLAFPR